MQRIQCLIFDLDGLLVDSEPLARQVWEKVVGQYDRVLDDQTYSRIVGLRLEETSCFLQERLDIPAEPAELARQKEDFLTQLSQEGVPSMPGLDTLMRELQLRQIPWGVATSNRTAFATQVLQQLDLWSTCKSLTTGQDVQRGKPAPDIYLLAAERMTVMPQHCLALEDSVPGAQAARAAGMVTVAIPGAHEAVQAFYFVDFVYDSLGDVAEDLDKLLAASPPSG